MYIKIVIVVYYYALHVAEWLLGASLLKRRMAALVHVIVGKALSNGS